MHDEEQVARRAAARSGQSFARDAHPRAVLDTRGDAHVDRPWRAAAAERQRARRAMKRLVERQLDGLLEVLAFRRASA